MSSSASPCSFVDHVCTTLVATHNLLDLCHICKLINSEPGPVYTGKTYNVSVTGCLKDVPDKAAYMANQESANP